ncbi:MAG: thioredoxin domain-containing protein [Phycisphaerales bacterium]|nr:thioredoxin domain-containing protein [Phycisphaerales bacterium]
MKHRVRATRRSIAAMIRRHGLVAAIVLLSTAGGGMSLALLHAHLNPEGALLTRFCPASVDGGSGCAAALQTRWAEVSIPRPGPGFRIVSTKVPVAYLGAAYFTFLGLWFGHLGRARPRGARWHLIARTTAMMGGVISVGFVGLMALTSAPWCVWCLSVHAVNAMLVPLVWRATERPTRPTAVLAPTTLFPREAMAVMVVAGLACAGQWGLWRQARIHRHHMDALRPFKAMVDDLQDDPAFLLREFAAQPVVLSQPVPLRPSEPPAGDKPVMLVFSDFECPACRCEGGKLRERIATGLGRLVEVRVRHFPLCADCNPHVRDAHPNACDAAYAAEAARWQGGEDAFLRMYEALFAYPGTLNDDAYAHLARTIGLDGERLLRDMRSPVIRDLVAADIELGVALGIEGTPTTLLDGRVIPEICETDAFFSAYATPAPAGPVHATPERRLHATGSER